MPTYGIWSRSEELVRAEDDRFVVDGRSIGLDASHVVGSTGSLGSVCARFNRT